METIISKIYHLNSDEAGLVRQLIRNITAQFHSETGFIIEKGSKNRIKNIQWVQVLNVFGYTKYYELHFNYDGIEMLCEINGYVVQEICNGENDFFDKPFRPVVITVKETQLERVIGTLCSYPLFTAKIEVSYGANIFDVKEGKIEASSLKTNKITCNTSDLVNHQF